MKSKANCYHCGNDCSVSTALIFEEKNFCCNGCKTVFQILNENELTSYYDFEDTPGKIPEKIEGKYDYLENEKIVSKLLEFDTETTSIVTLNIPFIHCSSCIWVLENLHKINPKIQSSQVNFPKKTVRIVFDKNIISLKKIVLLLSSIGYEPYISLESAERKKNKTTDKSLIYKLGVAGFAFGNIMFLSFPEYFEVDEFWLNQYKPFFRWIMFLMAMPVLFYSARDYFSSAFKGLKHKILNIDVPISLGILVLFIRSTIEIFYNIGQGYFDSMTGLVFFLLLGKFFQQRTYSFLSFERDYTSYFPIAVTRIKNNKEEAIQIYDVKKGDRLLIRNQELIPVDGIIIKGNGLIDYSFVTGEANPIPKNSGDKLFAGGKQLDSVLEIEAIKTVSQSYLTQLWSNDVFNKDKNEHFKNITDKISQYFTYIILGIAFIAGLYWSFYSTKTALNVVSSVLIIACPCALALSAPFTLGNIIRIFGAHKFYLKNASVIESLAEINTLIFDKTGTITSASKQEISYQGSPLSNAEEKQIKTILRNSNHPLSRTLYDNMTRIPTLEGNLNYKEIVGKGISGSFQETIIKIGSSSFTDAPTKEKLSETAVHININGIYKGRFSFKNKYRNGMFGMFRKLQKNFNLTLLSGDNEGEKKYLTEKLPSKTSFVFDQKPEDKLTYIKTQQKLNQSILMFGDGLNDAGALAQSNVGVAVSENVNVFSPACDAIIDASVLHKAPLFLKISKKSIKIIKASFVLSFLYNIVGLYFATTGQLSPVIAAILMPLSSISVVVFVTLATNYVSKSLTKDYPLQQPN
ncbi:heavy metal translocating P-type ATPase metal-binding domain-containing protein [Flavicella sp.]|uniref:heavy metal translocating P-type ATPase n=1 Tax=Flavicella sp. TaxID=2957742 RepID=UPI002604BAD0|nr:heavy metal translocating P-type ATPase metal-binding domain-containing protein [Flavicella sp.]MDG1804593.1 heavy metal translocating P-type ATPase metal-binding domain-containing protein [Flavicella sp.]